MSFLHRFENEVRHRKENRKLLSDISSSFNVSKSALKTKSTTAEKETIKTKINLSTLIKTRAIDKCNSKEAQIQQHATNPNSSIFEIAKRSKPKVIQAVIGDERHQISKIPIHNTIPDTKNKPNNSSITRQDLKQGIPGNDPILLEKTSLTSQAVSDYKVTMNWFEATNYQYTIRDSKDLKRDETLFTIKKVTKFNEYSYFAEIMKEDNKVIKVMLNRLRHIQSIDSTTFDDESLASKRIGLKSKDGELQIDKVTTIPCYSKWHIYT